MYTIYILELAIIVFFFIYVIPFASFDRNIFLSLSMSHNGSKYVCMSLPKPTCVRPIVLKD